MSSTDSISNNILFKNGTGALRFAPEPKTGMSRGFRSALDAAENVVSAGASVLLGLDPKYEALLQKQLHVQEQMQLISLRSNIEKSKHDSKMAAIRNIRVA